MIIIMIIVYFELPTFRGAPEGFITPSLTSCLAVLIDPDIWSRGGAAGLPACQRGRVSLFPLVITPDC